MDSNGGVFKVETLQFDNPDAPGRTVDVHHATNLLEAHEYAASMVDADTQPRKAFVYRLNEWSQPTLDHIVRQRSFIREAVRGQL
jgi:hypothetical protein